MFKVIVRWSNGDTSDFLVDKDTISLGRDPDNDIFLPSSQASRKHARVYRKDDAVIIEDLESANGTFIRDEQLKLPQAISSEDPVKLGDVFVRIEYQDSSALPEYLRPKEVSEYSIAQRLGDRKLTTQLGSDASEELRKMLERGEDPTSRKKK